MHTDDIIINAIKRKYSSKICQALRDQEPFEISPSQNRLTLALSAEASVLYSNERPEIAIEARCFHANPNHSIGMRKVFTSEAITEQADIYAIADHIIVGLRHEIIQTFLKIIADKKGE